MPQVPREPYTEGSNDFHPDSSFSAWGRGDGTPLQIDNFREFIIRFFYLPEKDDYGYQATTTVTLSEAQRHLNFGAQGGLHRWYVNGAGKERFPPPSAADITAYTDIFRSTTNTTKALNGFLSNAKKDSIRADVAKHLQSLYEPPSAARNLVVGKNKNHVNIYFDIWAWSNQNLEWAGPEQWTVLIKQSHAILPILYHHFGCVCPSYEALSLISQLSKGRTIIDMGSGNGYWTYMLRALEQGKKQLNVIPVDNGLSKWRTMWIGDTVASDGEQWLKKNDRGKNSVLLLVYPNTGEEFTSKMIRAYAGTTIVAASSQNYSGFTAFAEETIADWMAREMSGWTKILQIPLPSFAGKDEALFVFEKQP